MRTTNVELTPKRRLFLHHKYASLCRLLPADSYVHYEVVMRQTHSKTSGDHYTLSVTLETVIGNYMAVSTARSFRTAVNQTRLILKRQVVERNKVRRKAIEHNFDMLGWA